MTDWTPFVVSSLAPTEENAKMQAITDAVGQKRPKRAANSRFQIEVYEYDKPPEGWPAMVHLSFKTHDRDVMLPWSDYQRVKNEIIGPGADAIEIMPAESRLVDTSNQFHLWVFDPDAIYPMGLLPHQRHPRCPRIVKPTTRDILARAKSHYRPPAWTRFTQVRIAWDKVPADARPERPVLGVFINSRYEVWAFSWPSQLGEVVSLSVRRHDGYPWRDWRDLQRIKNEIAGPEREAVELFPDEIRNIDVGDFDSILWVLPPGIVHPFGLSDTRLVSETVSGAAKQRPWEDDESRPGDLVDLAATIDIIKATPEQAKDLLAKLMQPKEEE